MGFIQELQNYTVVGSVGATGQQFAGRDYTLAELQAYFTAPKVISYYRFGAGAALGTDDVGTYSYTLGAAGKAPSNTTGIMNTNYAISFDGGDYATNATKFDDMTTTFSGAGKGLIHSFWLTAPTDGQPAATNRLFRKANSAANDLYSISLRITGDISITTNGNSATAKSISSSTVLANGANTTWLHIVFAWNTTRGLELYVNGRREAQDPTATTLMADNGVGATDFFIGASNTTPTEPLTGIITNEAVINDVCTQAMVDFLYATTVPIPAALSGYDFELNAYMRPQVAAGGERKVWCDEVYRDANRVLISGGTRRSTDYYRLIGRV